MTPSERYRARLEINANRAFLKEADEDARRFTRRYLIATAIVAIGFIIWKSLT